MKAMLEQLALPTSDMQLIRRVGKGDQQAFGELYQRYELQLFSYLQRLVHDEHVAEDLLQEVFLALWHGAAGFRGQAKVSTWLFRVAHNQAVSWLRGQQGELPTDWLDEQPGDDGDPEELVLESFRNDRIRRALDSLSPDHRAVIELAFFYNLPYAQIAEIVDCPVGTVKSRISFARLHLSRLLAPDLGAHETEMD